VEATLAQLVEQLIRNQQVVGSNPTGGSKNSSKYKVLRVHLRGHSIDRSAIVEIWVLAPAHAAYVFGEARSL
jgi:hypothetical protein